MSEETGNPTKGIGRNAGKNDVPPTGKSWFLGIGINDYRHFPRLNNAVRDVEAILTLLRERYDVDEAELLIDTAGTRRNILRKLDDLARHVQPDDKLLVYFSGHGYLSPGGLGFWVPVDAEHGYTDDYIPNSRLRDYMSEVRSRHILLMMFGWEGRTYTHQCLYHIDIIDGKVWIQYNTTDFSIEEELVRQGILAQDIVLGLKHPDYRQFTDYAAA